jgi:hypothetical protein
MGALSNYLESGIINHVFRGSAYSAPSTLYIGLVKSFVPQNIENGIVDEPATGSYTRKAYASNATNWITPYTSGTALSTHNTTPIEFPIATANIGDVSGVFISDNVSSGNILFYGQLSSPRNIRLDDQFVFSSGALKVSFD